ncbi:MAG: rhodanese-like domain-containing protein, partial [Oscillospiraceae bacterium]|nr:rhodanese-like domain-containing protein [Oscillospiraceae bacterium]
ISPARAKALMDSEEGYVILDVRTPEEFALGHIAGAVLPLTKYEQRRLKQRKWQRDERRQRQQYHR